MRGDVSKVLKALLGQEGWITQGELCGLLHMSRRALTSALDGADEVLVHAGASTIRRVPGKGLGISGRDRHVISGLLGDGQGTGVALDLTRGGVRRFLMFFSIVSIDPLMTLEDHATHLGVSLRTASNDMGTLRRDLDRQGLRLVFERRQGYRIEGNAFVLRSLMLNELRGLCQVSTCQEAHQAIEGLFGTFGRRLSQFGPDELSELSRCVDDVLPNRHDADVRWTIVLQLVLLAIELPSRALDYGLIPEDRAFLEGSSTFELARFLRIRASELLGGDALGGEDHFLCALLQALPAKDHSNETSNYPFELEVATQKFILRVGREFGFDFQRDAELFRIAIAHAIPLMHRVRFGGQIVNPLLRDIADKYPRLHSAVMGAAPVLSERAGATVSEDECAFFTIYFASSIEKLVNAQRGQARVVTVCESGNAVSRFMLYKLTNSFNVEVAAAASSEDVAQVVAAAQPVDLVVSTVGLDGSDLAGTPWVRVSSLLSAQDYDLLNAQLSRRVLMSGPERGAPGLGLLDLLGPQRFEVCEGVANMDELIARAGRLLCADGLCDEEYPSRMIHAAHCFGALTTILIAPGIIMPHAGVGEHVWRTGFSFVRVRSPVIVNGREVICALALCARDKRDVQLAMQQVGTLLSWSNFMERVDGAQTYEELARLVAECLDKAEGRQVS